MRSFWTHSWMEALWLGMPLLILIRTAITVLMHSYSRLIAEVLPVQKKRNAKKRKGLLAFGGYVTKRYKTNGLKRAFGKPLRNY